VLREVGYFIVCERIRPFGRYNFAAHPVYQSGLSEQDFPEPPPRAEYWGETEEEAITKAREAVQAWAKRVGVSLVEF
jgi:hypothetical protein